MRGSSSACSMPMWPISTRHGRIKGWGSRFPSRKLDHVVPLHPMEATWLRFRSWPGCTMIIEKWRKQETTGPTMPKRAEECPDIIFDGQHLFERRPFGPASISPPRAFVSEDHVPFVSLASRVPLEKGYRGGEMDFLANGCSDESERLWRVSSLHRAN